MAWNVSGQMLTMAEGDYGVQLPVIVQGVTLGDSDSIRFTFKDTVNGQTILEKDYNGITENTVNLEFSEAESALFEVGSYVYSIDWYQSGSFMCNIVPSSLLKVVDKA